MTVIVSASSLNDFISCKRKVYYRIFKPVEPVKSIEAVKGTIVHKVLETSWVDILEADKVLRKESELLGLSDNDYRDCYYMVRNFFDLAGLYIKEGDLLEHKFRIKLEPDIYLVGVFDRVSSGKVFDWKTGKKTPSNLSNNIQFILYNYAYQKIFNSPSHGLYYVALRDRKIIRYNENPMFTDILFNETIPDFVKSVQSKSFERDGIYNGSCYKCDWKEHCLGNKE